MAEFDSSGFIDHLQIKFPSVFESACGSVARKMVKTLIDHAIRFENNSKDQFCDFLSDLLPEVEFGEVAAFMDDSFLTATYGIPEKRRVGIHTRF